MALQLTVKRNERIYILLADGEEIEIEYIQKENGNKILAFKFPPIVRIYREAVYRRIKEEEKLIG